MKSLRQFLLLPLVLVSGCGVAESPTTPVKSQPVPIEQSAQVRQGDTFTAQSAALVTLLRLKESSGNLLSMVRQCKQNETYKPYCPRILKDVEMALALYDNARPALTLDQLMQALRVSVETPEEIIITSPAKVKIPPKE